MSPRCWAGLPRARRTGRNVSSSGAQHAGPCQGSCRKKKSARELLKTVREALPRLEREAAQEAIAAGEPWPPPKENGEW
jgi:hypothetical protein